MNQALAKREDTQLSGSYREASAINSRLTWAQDNAHLVSPATSAPHLPEGCVVALSMVKVDPKLDTYPTDGGKLGLGKSALQRIARGAGVSWDPRQSRRLDNGAHPYFCHYRAVGTYRDFDGTEKTIIGEKVLDLRDGSPTATGSKTNQLSQMRTHLAAHTETKAQLRAIRSMGIKTSYTAQELEKPFVSAQVMFTGATDNPALAERFADKIADAFLGARKSLYSGAEPEPKLLGYSPPSVGTLPEDHDSGEFDTETGQRFTTPSAPAARLDVRDPEPAPAAMAKPAPKAASGHVIPGGNSKGTPLEKASDRDLEYWANRIGNDLEQGNSRDESRDRPLHAAMVAELNSRGY